MIPVEECPIICANVTGDVPAAAMRVANVCRRLPAGVYLIPKPLDADGSQTNQCSNFVVVFGSERFKTGMKGPTLACCICLTSIVESEIFKTGQQSSMFYESAALTG
jgi:hypothetical protein